MTTTVRIVDWAALPAWPTPGRRLSTRQLAILDVLATGISQAEAGRQLYIMNATVSTQLRRARIKMGVETTAAALERLRTDRYRWT